MEKRRELVFNRLQQQAGQIEQQNLSPHACYSSKAIRLKKEADCPKFIRPPFMRDSDTIMHTNTYARYMDKTQVFYLFANQHITHRALHVQFVSSIARTIGRLLGLNEDLIEAIALGHDLGHPAFGHEGEGILNSIALEHDVGCFAHNVQSVRTLMNIEENGQGVNITLQVLDGILAHNGERVEQTYHPNYEKTINQFNDEMMSATTQNGYGRKINPMTLEGSVVKISDVIAYIGRDIEDAIHLNLLERSSIPRNISNHLGDNNRSIVDVLVDDLVENSFGKEYLMFSKDIYKALAALKDFNYQTIYYNPRIKGESKKIERMFHLLFNLYHASLQSMDDSSDIFTYFLKDRETSYVKNTSTARIVIDFMASMTDSFIINQFNKLFFPQNYGYFVPAE